MKAIALVVVVGGVAYAYAPEHVDIRIVDLDGIAAGDQKTELPKGVGFEALVRVAGVPKSVTWKREHESKLK
jgi:hypothetical protein